MSDTVTFTTVDGLIEFTVKKSFLDKVNNPEKFDAYDLHYEYSIIPYLHNPVGFAIRSIKTPEVQEYWIDGQYLKKEEGEKIIHNNKFNNKLLDEIVKDE